MSTRLLTLRPSGFLGDQSDASRVIDSVTATSTPQLGTLSVTAASLVAQIGNGTIDYVVVGARAYVNDSLGLTSDDMLTWTLGPTAASVAVAPWSRFVVSEVKTPNLTLDPNGDPWTWASVLALIDIGATVDYGLSSGQTVALEGAEAFVEVWGAPSGPFVHGSGVHGPVLGEGAHGDIDIAGLHGPYAGDGTHGDFTGSGLHGPVIGSGHVLGGGA